MIEVPAHVRHENFQQNQILVVGGTNWDLSRTAVETPIAVLQEPAPVVEQPQVQSYQPEPRIPTVFGPKIELMFAKDRSLLSKQMIQELKEGLQKHSTVSVMGHADKAERVPNQLAEARAKAVAAQLKRLGHPVKVSGGFGLSFPKTGDEKAAPLNRRVEVFEIEQPAKSPD
jgi:outer membrane protein OmpA-like peptidoglycan-associated protein